MGSCQKEEDLSSDHGSTEAGDKRCCSDCKTTKTPLWRSGPSGPKSLCNACGIKHRKNCFPKNIDLKKGKTGKSKGLKFRNPLKMNLMTPLEESVEQRLSVPVKKQRSPRPWGEVERAALLLMALSCGAVFD